MSMRCNPRWCTLIHYCLQGHTPGGTPGIEVPGECIVDG